MSRFILLGDFAAGGCLSGAAFAQADPSAVCAEAIARRESPDVSGVALDRIEQDGAGSVVMLSATNGESFTCHVDGAGAISKLEEED